MSTPSVTVVIPAHGLAGMVDACVDAVLETTDVAVDVLVVDDASPEPIAITASPRVRVVRNEENTGFAGACNRGAREAAGSIIVFLNSDTRVRGTWLDGLIGPLIAMGRAIVGGRLLYRDGTAQHAGICFGASDGLPRHLYRGFPGDHPAVTRSRRLQAVTGACLAVAKTDFHEIGGFDEAYRNGFEDIDLCLRAGQAGITVWYCGDTDITHLESVSLPSSKPSDPNAERFANRWADTPVRDELQIYADDGLIALASDDVYPLRVRIDPLLATADQMCGIDDLLNIRSRQVFDLEKEIGYLSARLLDHGIEP